MSAGKILFVEDELSQNVANLLRLFEKYLSSDERSSLIAIENDTSSFGSTNEEIKAIFKDNPFVDVEYSFPGALKAVIGNHDEYDLFIVDRNLSVPPATLDDIRAIKSNFSDSMHEQFSTREGDFLLESLAKDGINCCESFYFMTANTGDALRNDEGTIERLIYFEKFKIENFLEKGKSEDFDSLREVVNDLKTLNLVKKYRDVFEVFEKGWIDNTFKKGLVDALKNMDNHHKKNIDNNAVTARQILASIYDTLLDNGVIPENIYNNKHGKFWALRDEAGVLAMRTIIDHLKWKRHLSGLQLPTAEFTYGMASEIVHWKSGRPEASKYSNQALVCSLCDSILWFKEKMKEQGCK